MADIMTREIEDNWIFNFAWVPKSVCRDTACN